ncbi:hypothetical protein ACT7C3_00870 [Bacillus pacificus]
MYTFLFCYKNYNRLGDKSITALQWVLFLYYKIGLVYKNTKKIQLRKGVNFKDFQMKLTLCI